MKYTRSLFIFRQDLRIQDNTGLFHAIEQGKEVIPVFIFDTEILQHFPSPDPRLGFLLDALISLDNELKKKGGYLTVLYGKATDIIPQLLEHLTPDAVYINKAYDSYGQSRDGQTKLLCQSKGVEFHQYDDFLLVEPDAVEQRKVFTPFYKLRQRIPKRVQLLEISKLHTPHIDITALPVLELQDSQTATTIGAGDNRHRPVHIGDHAKVFDYNNYDDTRNFPGLSGTSRLSPYIRFGLLSVREVCIQALQAFPLGSDNNGTIVTMDPKIFSNSYVSELARREFWQHISHYFPETKTIEFQEKRRNLQRDNNEERFEKWKSGQTGYPIVDAGMRQLKEENRMHGRVRMVVASFLTKDLLIDRRQGEKHFADYLIDYDENVNYGNRQWSASVGADPKPLRIFNPILQSQRFDADTSYILKRCPELTGQETKAIHDPIKYDLDYISPIVDHYVTSKEAKKMYYHESYSL